MNQLFVNSGASSSAGNFKRTNYILKEAAAKLWPTYGISGTTEFKPYPVFDESGNPCPTRMPSKYESDGKVPEADSLTAEEIREYESEVIPQAFISVPTATWVGKDGVQFIDYCSDLGSYASADEQEAGVLPPTPYTVMTRVLNKLIPTDRNPNGDGQPCPPTLAKARNPTKGVIGLKFPAQTVLCRGALKRLKGKPMETKSSSNGVLWRVCLMISQTSARLALRNEFSKKVRPQDPIGPNNFALQGMFDPMGTYLAFAKINPADRASDITVKADYDEAFNRSLVEFFSASDEGEYYAKVREELGAFGTLESMLNIMTVQQQMDLILDQFPAAWVWYGLRDSVYASLVPEDVQRAALRDPEWLARFGVAGVSTTRIPAEYDAIPMPTPPVGGFVPSNGGGFKVTSAPPEVANIMKEASVEYKPSTTSQNADEAAQKILKKWGVK